jgi:phospholipid/cholesterol/gamma-HCH transport system ATP-binding protein
MSHPSIEISRLFFAYDQRRPILKDISLSIPGGRIVAVMGGSGSGKTTLLRNICGQIAPSQGMVQVLGKRINDISTEELFALRRRVGMMFQFGGLFTDMSVFDNVAFPLREHTELSKESIRDLVMLKLQAVGLRGSAKLFPSELSGGMARRVALARAIALDPDLILYDEPFAGLDPISLAITARLIRELNEALNATTIIVTHDVAESFQIVDYVYLMWQGEIVAEGEPSQMRNSSLPYVRQFINAETDGPLPFHQPAAPLMEDLEIPALAGR